MLFRSTSSQPDCLVHLRRGIWGFPIHQAPPPGAPRPQAGSEALRAHLALGVPAPPRAGPQQVCAQGRGGSRHPALRCLPVGLPAPTPAGHAPSGPGPGLSPGQSPSQPTHCLLDFFRGCSSPGDQTRRGGQAWGSTLCLSIPRQLAGPRQGTGTAVRVCLPFSSRPCWPGSLPGACDGIPAARSRQGPPPTIHGPPQA